jgi:hypothetical protein
LIGFPSGNNQLRYHSDKNSDKNIKDTKNKVYCQPNTMITWIILIFSCESQGLLSIILGKKLFRKQLLLGK